MKIPPSLCGIRVIREIRGQKNQPRITQISRKNHNESDFHSQWRAAGSWKLGGKYRIPAVTTKTRRHKEPQRILPIGMIPQILALRVIRRTGTSVFPNAVS